MIWQELFSLSFRSIRLQRIPGHSFLSGNDAADELSRRRVLLVPSAIPCSLSSLISRIHSCLFSDWRRTASYKFFDTQIPLISIEELELRCHARCVPCRLRSNGHTLLLSSYRYRIGRIENPFYSACGHSSQDTSHLILHCPATDSLCPHSLATLCSSTTCDPEPEELLGFWGSMVFHHASIPQKGSSNNSNNNNLMKIAWLGVIAMRRTQMGLQLRNIHGGP